MLRPRAVDAIARVAIQQLVIGGAADRMRPESSYQLAMAALQQTLRHGNTSSPAEYTRAVRCRIKCIDERPAARPSRSPKQPRRSELGARFRVRGGQVRRLWKGDPVSIWHKWRCERFITSDDGWESARSRGGALLASCDL